MRLRAISIGLFAGLLLACGSFSAWSGDAQPAPAKGPADTVITVGHQSVSVPDFEQALRLSMRQKFYHGKVPADQLTELQRAVADELVARILLLQEARRRGIEPDEEKIQQAIRGYDQQYKGNPNYDKNRDKMLAGVVGKLKEDDLLGRLERSVRELPLPSEEETREFYQANQQLFTEPEKIKVSVILLAVDPSSGSKVWDKAHEEALKIHERLLAGADFAELARLHSRDRSADKGGDMGYLHRGMLAESVEESLDKAKLGEILLPIRILEGEAIFRLDDRVASQLRPFDAVKGRAAELLRRERADAAWKALKGELRKGASVTIDEARFPEIAARLKLD